MTYTVFTSYRRENAERVGSLELAMRLRGVASWRDVRKIPHGAETVAEIERAITHETDGFLAVVTPSYLARREGRRDVVWEDELRCASARWSSGNYPLTPLFLGAEPAQLTARCHEEGLADLARANGKRLREDAILQDDRETARAQLANALRAAGPDITLVFRSFDMRAPEGAVLDVDWSGEVEAAGEERWDAAFLPALEDLRDALLQASVGRIEVNVLARLSALLALGMRLPLATRIDATFIGREGESWPIPHEAGVRHPLVETCEERKGEPCVAVIELSLVADLARDAAIVADRVGAARRVRLASASADRSADLRPVAAAAAAQVGDVLRRLRDDGVTDYHVLLASPAPLAALIGRHLHALGTVHVYFSNRDRVISRAYSVRV